MPIEDDLSAYDLKCMVLDSPVPLFAYVMPYDVENESMARGLATQRGLTWVTSVAANPSRSDETPHNSHVRWLWRDLKAGGHIVIGYDFVGVPGLYTVTGPRDGGARVALLVGPENGRMATAGMPLGVTPDIINL